MKNTKSVFSVFYKGIIFSLLGITVLLSSCVGFDGAAKKPQATLSSIELTRIDFKSVTLQVNLEVKNPTIIPLKIAGYDYSFQAFDKEFITGRMNKSISVPAGKQVIVPLPLTVSYADFKNISESMANTKMMPYEINLGIDLNAFDSDILRLEVTGKGEIPIFRNPKISLVNIDLKSINFRRADIALDLEVANNNDFSMTLRGITGRLSMAGYDIADIAIRKSQTIGFGETKILNVELSLLFAETGRALWEALTTEENMDVKLQGSADVSLDFPSFQDSSMPMDISTKISLTR